MRTIFDHFGYYPGMSGKDCSTDTFILRASGRPLASSREPSPKCFGRLEMEVREDFNIGYPHLPTIHQTWQWKIHNL
jgi:hypothetical protein